MRTTLALVWALAACASDDGRAARTAPIVNGTPDTGDPATVFLWLGGGSCTGTLISPHVVLTARHCLEGTSPSSVQVFFGSDADQAGTWIDAVDLEIHPDGDIGILAMAEVGPTPPIPVNDRDLSAHVGEPVRIVGFGVTSENGGGSGLKRQGMTSLHHVDGDIMYTGYDASGSWTCYGDSGGPNFMTLDGVEHVAGVTSFGTSACGEPADGAVRTDVYYQWIMEYVDAHDPATCAGDGRCASGCPAPDPDCPCAADGLCAAACGDVSSDPDCAGCAAGDACREDCPVPDPDCAPPEPPDAGPGGGDDDDDDGTGQDPGGPGDFSGGCAVGGRGGAGAGIWLWLALLALAIRRYSITGPPQP